MNIDEEIRQRYVGRIDATTTGQAALDSAGLANALLAEWNPVGRPVSELQVLMGEPTVERDGGIEYRFRGGRTTVTWRFAVAEGKVTAVEYVPGR